MSRLGTFVTADQLTADHKVALAHLSETLEALRVEASGGRLLDGTGLILYTEANNMALILSAEGTPYRFGGIDPFNGGADCSGLFYWAALQCVDANGHQVVLPRTTSGEWNGLPHNSDWQACPIGQPIEFEVPSDGPPLPQHVGVNVGGGFMVDDPHTGAVVRREAIPNEAGVIWPYGFVTLPFVTTPSPPKPNPPTPSPVHEEAIEVSTVEAQNGDLVSLAITTPSSHLVEITRKAGNQGGATNAGLSIIDFTAQWPQFTVQEIKDVVVAANGDIVAHVLTPGDHYCEVTRKAGSQGQAATDGVSIVDFTAAFPQFDIEP